MGTLVHEPFYRDVPQFFGVTLEELRRLKHPTAWIDFERGLIDEAEYLQRFFLDGRLLDGEALKRAMYESYRLLDGVEEILVALRSRGVEMHALSNYSPWYVMIEEKLRLSRYLEWTFVSCKTGRRKPEPESYLGAAQALNRAPGELLFVDDRRVNCEAAQSVGLPAIHFTGAGDLRAALEARGLL